MSMVPRWRSRFLSSRRLNEIFNLNKFFEELDQGIETAGLHHSGLSVSSDEQNVYIEAAVPGLSSKEVEVSIDSNNVLWIKGEKKAQEKDKNKKFYRQSQSSFFYCIPLWKEVDTSTEPDAQCKDGMMKIIFAKKKESQAETKKINVKE